MIKYTIHSKKWIDKVNGNTYHSVRIINNETNEVITSPFKYGYGDQFLQSAREKMKAVKWIGEKFTPEDYLSIHIVDEKDCKKKEVNEWGKQ